MHFFLNRETTSILVLSQLMDTLALSGTRGHTFVIIQSCRYSSITKATVNGLFTPEDSDCDSFGFCDTMQIRSHHNKPIPQTFKACLHVPSKSPFFGSSTFDLFNVKCKQCHRTASSPILNGTKNGNVDSTCKRSLNPLNPYSSY